MDLTLSVFLWVPRTWDSQDWHEGHHTQTREWSWSYLHVALVGGPYAPLHIHAQGPLGLLGRNGAHLGSTVSAGHVASKGAH